ncbi:MAG: family 10 glycosylhydrolase [Defluviitaleaceae bacterium]|nr:family 10 glycosylhydrolase [Defluviitaleaceae bacterium]
MKKYLFAAMVAFIMFLGAVLPMQLGAARPETMEMRGLWVTSAYNLDWPSRQGLTPAQTRSEIDDILERAAAQGINAVFVQVRPVADALYRSEIFPWSHLISGTQGLAPAQNFDPLEYWVERAHSMGIQVHAWLNPYRVTFPNQQITNPAELSANHPARLDPSLVIAYGNSLFFDPGNPAARQLIIDGAEELLRNFNIDGIHLDDYFYPSRNFPDQATFARHGRGMDIHDWRRENVNTLIRDLQAMTHRVNPNASFGVSPTAIWMNEETDPRGKATRGSESFHRAYADTRLWVTEGWVDYIVPQIYWIEGYAAACFNVVLSWWEDLVRGTDVRLYIGLAPYREASRLTIPRFAIWSDGEIINQLTRIGRSDVARGNIMFRERFMRTSVGDAIGAFYTQHLPGQVPTRAGGARPVTPNPVAPTTPATPANPQIPTPTQNLQMPGWPPVALQRPADPPSVRMDSLLVASPRVNRTVVDAAGFFFYGSGVPGVPVYVNGQLVENRTEDGFFSVFMPLVRGANNFTFTQQGQTAVTRVITNNAPAGAAAPATMAQAGITNAFPAYDEWAQAGETITLRATAPGGATVTAQIGGQTVTLTQTNANLRATAGNIIAAQFTGSFTLNATAADNAIVDIGRPVYTMAWNGQTTTATAAGMVRQLGANAPFFAEITGNAAWAFPQATTTGGSGWLMTSGQRDRVRAVTGGWTQLASGGWVESAGLRTFRDEALVPPNPLGFMSEGMYVSGNYRDVITWEVPFFPGVLADFDGETLILSIGIQNNLPPIFHNPENGLFSEIRICQHDGVPSYFMTLRSDAHLEGFYVEHSNGQLRLNLLRRRALTPGQYPFRGFTFVVDAGHGGDDVGAVGAIGPSMAESHIVLAQADLLTERLQSLGATVVRVRDSNTAYTLQNRVDISRRAKPDMFLSLHTNATGETTDATNIRGFTVWHRNPGSYPAARSFMNSLYNINPATNRHQAPNQANFFVCRPQWAPHILLEASFTNNIQDFAWLINPRRQSDYVWGIVNALLAYYG